MLPLGDVFAGEPAVLLLDPVAPVELFDVRDAELAVVRGPEAAVIPQPIVPIVVIKPIASRIDPVRTLCFKSGVLLVSSCLQLPFLMVGLRFLQSASHRRNGTRRARGGKTSQK